MLRTFLIFLFIVLLAGCDGSVQIFNWEEPDPSTILIYNDSVQYKITVQIERFDPELGEYRLKKRVRLGKWDKYETIWPLGEEYRLSAFYDRELAAGLYRYWSQYYHVLVDDRTEQFYKNSNWYGEIIIFDPETFRDIETLELYITP